MVKRVESMAEPSTDQTKEELLAFVRDMRQPRPPRPLKQRRVKPFRRHQVRRPAVKYSPEIKKLIINLYYQNGYRSEPAYSIGKVSRMLNFPKSTVGDVIRKFRNTQNIIDAVKDKRCGLFKRIPHDIQRELVSPSLLQEW